MNLPHRKRLQWSRVLFILCGVLICCVYQLTLRSRYSEAWSERQIEDYPGTAESMLKPDKQELMVPTHGLVENLGEEITTSAVKKVPPVTPAHPLTTTSQTNLRHCIYVDPEDPKPTESIQIPTARPTLASSTTSSPHMKGEYPEDLFSVDQRRQGWIILHIFGMIYMFVSLAIVCDEFFVPALGVITDKLDISDDVAGATFMAAGGSAPELFTSLIGVFISHSNVGIGTIVGSAVFNILFVIGMCALFSREMLHLTWWPLFRDVSFYIMDLIMLIVFFLDSTIMWWESILLLLAYMSYVCFMKYNVQLEYAFKTQLNKHKNIVKAIALEEPEKDDGTPGDDNPSENPEDKNRLKLRPALQRGGSSASLHNSTMRSTIFQLMIHTLDPLGEESVFNGDIKAEVSEQGKVKFKDKAEILHKMARGKVESKARGKAEDGDVKRPDSRGVAEASTSQAPAKEEEKAVQEQKGKGGASGGGSEDSDSSEEDSSDEESDNDSEDEDNEDEEKEEPLSLEWPDSRRKQATYLFLLPIVFPLWLTLPDVRSPASKKYFAVTFLGSIVWIAVFSYLMVWWAHQVGETVGISEEIMGLTILAAGTSIPDLITSVIVARKGLGDMAVSSSVGSNIFDITMGLPLPWLIYSLFSGLAPVAVSSNGLFCAIVLLFLMLLFVILSIAACKWKMNKRLGLTMFLLYFVFLVLSVMLEDRIIICPVSI